MTWHAAKEGMDERNKKGVSENNSEQKGKRRGEKRNVEEKNYKERRGVLVTAKMRRSKFKVSETVSREKHH